MGDERARVARVQARARDEDVGRDRLTLGPDVG
jgi:hypothetical protein